MTNLVYTLTNVQFFGVGHNRFVMFEHKDFANLDTFKVANILACLPQNIRQPLIASLQQHRPNIGYLSMRFEDLKSADDQGLKALIAAVNRQTLIMAMSTADTQLVNRLGKLMDDDQAAYFIQQIDNLHQSEKPEHFFNAFDAKIDVITHAAKLRQSGKMSVEVKDHIQQEIPNKVVEEIKAELQQACEKAMASVLACYLPEAAAAVLCQRQDKEQILQQMLQLDKDDFCDVLNDEEIEKLLCDISDEDVF